MTTKELLAIVKDRGLSVGIKDGRPVLQGAANNPKVTDALLSVLKIHRERIIEILLREQNASPQHG
jgi:hypothetical protein